VKTAIRYIAISVIYWSLALFIFVFIEATFDSYGAGDGLGASGGVIPVISILVAATGYVYLLKQMNTARRGGYRCSPKF
jgi:hypothetical protein